MIGRHRIGLLGQAMLMLGVVQLPPPRDAKTGLLEVTGRRGPGHQLRDERERVGEPLRILAAYAGLTPTALGEIERGAVDPTPEQWTAFQFALPGLGPMEPLPTAEQRSPIITQLDLHPCGCCTCGQQGACAWCEMNRRRELRETRKARRAGRDAPPDEPSGHGEREQVARQGARNAKAAKKARRGW